MWSGWNRVIEIRSGMSLSAVVAICIYKGSKIMCGRGIENTVPIILQLRMEAKMAECAIS